MSLFAAVFLAAGCASAPQSVVGDYLAGRLAARANDTAAAAAAYARAHAQSPGQVAILKDAFFFHLANGDLDNGAVYAREIVAAGADEDGLARVTLAAAALDAGRLNEARARLVGVPAGAYTGALAVILRAWIEAGLSGPEAALKSAPEKSADPAVAFFDLHRALLAEMAGDIETARAAHDAAFNGLGGPVGRAAYGAFLERHDPAAARQYYELFARQPGPERRLAQEGLERLAAGKATKAFEKLTPRQGAAIGFYTFAAAMIEQAEQQRVHALQLGLTLGDPHLSHPLALVQTAIRLDPDLAEARRLAGAILNLHGDHAGAYATLEKVSPSSPYHETARIEMAAALAAAERNDEARRALKSAIRRDERSLEMRLVLAQLEASEDRHADAVSVLDAAIARLDLKPAEDAWRFYVARGASLLELDRWPQAEQDLKRAVELAPNEPTALNYLGYSWAERGLNLEEAFLLLEKASSLRPDSGAIVDSVGWAHYQLGRYKEAATHLERAATLEPSDPTVTDHLGDVYWRLGRKTEARFQWRRALDLDPSEKQAEAIKRKLERGLEKANDEPKS